MRPPAYKRCRRIVRIKPGGFLRIPPAFLRHFGWQPGDVIVCMVEDGYLRLFKPPSMTTRRLERLRRRIAQKNTWGKKC